MARITRNWHLPVDTKGSREFSTRAPLKTRDCSVTVDGFSGVEPYEHGLSLTLVDGDRQLVLCLDQDEVRQIFRVLVEQPHKMGWVDKLGEDPTQEP